MRLRYFKNKNYTNASLKADRNDLAKKFHPDICKDKDATQKMQIIKDEYEYLKKNIKEDPRPLNDSKLHSVKEPNANLEFLKKAAQNIFHALTSAKGVDYTLLMDTINKIPNGLFKDIAAVYFNQYGFDLITHVNTLVKVQKIKKLIILSLKVSKGELNIFELFTYMQKFC